MSGLPHVTAILCECGMRRWVGVYADMAWYLNRGTMIHQACTLYDMRTLDWSTVDERIAGFVGAWVRFCEESAWRVTECEREVYSLRYGYVGRLDRVFRVRHRGLLLLDIKTNEADAVTRLQTMAYAIAYGKSVRRGAVALKEDGTYRLDLYDDDASDRAAWLACLNLVAWKRRNNA